MTGKLPKSFLHSEALSYLRPVSRLLIDRLIFLRRGRALDGAIACSENTAAQLCGVTRLTGRAALKELEALGFIACILRGSYRRKGVASLWRLTMFDFLGEPATHDYLRPTRVDRYLKDRIAAKAERGSAKIIPLFAPEANAA